MGTAELINSIPAGHELKLSDLAFGGEGEVALSFATKAWRPEVPADFVLKAEGVTEVSISELITERKGKPVSGAIETLTIAEDHPLLLDYGPRASIFGQSPLPDPYRFFLEFHKLVRDQFAIPREPLRYLNYKGRMAEWLGIVYSRSYGLLTAPEPVATAATALLDAQVALYHVLPEPALGTPGAYKVLQLGSQWIIAKEFKIV